MIINVEIQLQICLLYATLTPYLTKNSYLCKYITTNMTKEELLSRLNGEEWNDFEVKEAKNEIPKNAWETVSAFSNSYGGRIVFGIKENRR